MTTHTCPIDGCTKVIPTALAMCGEHWRACPASLRAALVTSWNTFKRARKPNLRLAAHRHYAQIRASAIASVNQQLSKGAA